MEPSLWSTILVALSSPDIGTCVEACERLHQESKDEDIPMLLQRLKNEDFFVREAAAWPLAELAGPSVLSELFAAYQRGFDEGYDNDGFTGTLIEITSLHPREARLELQQIIASAKEPINGHAVWLLGFCEPNNLLTKSDA